MVWCCTLVFNFMFSKSSNHSFPINLQFKSQEKNHTDQSQLNMEGACCLSTDDCNSVMVDRWLKSKNTKTRLVLALEPQFNLWGCGDQKKSTTDTTWLVSLFFGEWYFSRILILRSLFTANIFLFVSQPPKEKKCPNHIYIYIYIYWGLQNIPFSRWVTP